MEGSVKGSIIGSVKGSMVSEGISEGITDMDREGSKGLSSVKSELREVREENRD